MFTQPCFIRKYSRELCEKLERLGLGLLNFNGTTLDCHNYDGKGHHRMINEGRAIITYESSHYGVIYEIDDVTKWGRIDCGTNERLFLAIAALRNDTDKYQLFCNDKGEFFKCYENEFSHFRFDTNDIFNIANAIENGSSPVFGKPLVPYEDTKNWHKATVEELIEHFKYK